MFREEIIGRARLILGDCAEILPEMPFVDAVVTDPPYGMLSGATGQGKGWQGSCGKGRLWFEEPDWDTPPAAELLVGLTRQPAIIWGGNYFPSLPASGAWLVWDKCADMTQAQAELAWTNCAPTVRIFRKSPLGAFGNGGANGEVKGHPTQKPLSLMKWCLGFVPDAQTILDPFMGSGTTGVAAIQMGKAFVGVEREAEYFELACERIAAANGDNAGPLFGEAA